MSQCTVCDANLSPFGGETRCARCEEPCPTCGGDVALCTHPLPCDHHSARHQGGFRCLKCGARYIIGIGGARWTDNPRKRRAA